MANFLPFALIETTAMKYNIQIFITTKCLKHSGLLAFPHSSRCIRVASLGRSPQRSSWRRCPPSDSGRRERSSLRPPAPARRRKAKPKVPMVQVKRKWKIMKAYQQLKECTSEQSGINWLCSALTVGKEVGHQRFAVSTRP